MAQICRGGDRWSPHLSLLLGLALLCGCATRGLPPVCGIPNFGAVSGTPLFRGAQPPKTSLPFLRDTCHVGTVVNLRDDELPWEEQAVEDLGMEYANYRMSGTAVPDLVETILILERIERLPGPVYLHCQHGCDRTGLLVACWRIWHDGWRPEVALAEAKAYGFSPWLPRFHEFILRFPAKPLTPPRVSLESRSGTGVLAH